MKKGDLVLIDTNVIIEAVRTGCWPAITGQLRVETVEACRLEALGGTSATISGYVPVSENDLHRLAAIHAVSGVARAAFKLSYAEADGLDPGEHDLLAHAHSLPGGSWLVCSPDKASVRAAVAMGFGDRLCSLEDLIKAVGARSRPPLRRHFGAAWLVSFRTKVRLEGL